VEFILQSIKMSLSLKIATPCWYTQAYTRERISPKIICSLARAPKNFRQTCLTPWKFNEYRSEGASNY